MKKLIIPFLLFINVATFGQTTPPALTPGAQATQKWAKAYGDYIKYLAEQSIQSEANLRANGLAIRTTKPQADSISQRRVADSLANKVFSINTDGSIINTGTTQNPLLGVNKTQRTISAATTVLSTDYTIIITSGSFTQPLPALRTVEFYNTGSGTIVFTYNGNPIKQLSPGTANSPDYVKFTWSPLINSYLTH